MSTREARLRASRRYEAKRVIDEKRRGQLKAAAQRYQERQRAFLAYVRQTPEREQAERTAPIPINPDCPNCQGRPVVLVGDILTMCATCLTPEQQQRELHAARFRKQLDRFSKSRQAISD
jgi:hypothetical protein